MKVSINNTGERPNTYHEGGIYWTYLGDNIGMEQDGGREAFARPTLIVRGFSKELVFCVPISSKQKTGEYYFPIQTGKISGVLLLSQLRAIDTLRIGRHIADVSGDFLDHIKQIVSNIIQK